MNDPTSVLREGEEGADTRAVMEVRVWRGSGKRRKFGGDAVISSDTLIYWEDKKHDSPRKITSNLCLCCCWTLLHSLSSHPPHPTLHTPLAHAFLLLLLIFFLFTLPPSLPPSLISNLPTFIVIVCSPFARTFSPCFTSSPPPPSNDRPPRLPPRLLRDLHLHTRAAGRPHRPRFQRGRLRRCQGGHGHLRRLQLLELP